MTETSDNTNPEPGSAAWLCLRDKAAREAVAKDQPPTGLYRDFQAFKQVRIPGLLRFVV